MGDGNEGVLHIPQISIITCTSPSVCLEAYPRHWLGESYLFTGPLGGSLAPLQRSGRRILGHLAEVLPLSREVVGVFYNPLPVTWTNQLFANDYYYQLLNKGELNVLILYRWPLCHAHLYIYIYIYICVRAHKRYSE